MGADLLREGGRLKTMQASTSRPVTFNELCSSAKLLMQPTFDLTFARGRRQKELPVHFLFAHYLGQPGSVVTSYEVEAFSVGR